MLVHLRLPVVALCGLLLVAPERARERAAVPPAPPRFDVYGDPLPKGAVARVGTVRFRLPNPASNYDRQFFEGGRLPTERGRIAVSPDGRWLVTTAFGGAPVHVWELATGKLARVIDAPKVGGDVETVLALAFAPDARLLVLTRAGALRACDPASGTWSEASSRARPAPSFDERGFESIPPCAAVSPDGTHFAFVGRGKPFSAEVLAADREKPVLRLRGAPVTPDVCQPALAPDNARLALPLADGTLGVFDVASGNAVGTWKGPDDSRLVVAAFAPNGRTVAGVFVPKHANLQHTHDWELVVWDAATGAPRVRVPKWPGLLLGYTPDGAHLLCATKTRETGELVVTDAATGAEVERYAHGTGALCAATATPDGKRLVTVGEDGAITVWNRATRAPVRFDESPRGFLYNIALSPDGNTLFVPESDSVARLWDANTGLRLHALAAPSGRVIDAQFAPDSSRVFVAYTHGEYDLTVGAAVRQWNVRDGALVREYQLPARRAYPFVLAPDASHLFVRVPGLFLGADLPTGARRADVHSAQGHSVVAYPKRGELIEVHDGEHEGYKHEYVATNRLTGAVLGKWKVPITPNLRAVSPDGKYVATDEPAEDHTKPIVIRRVTGERLCVAPVERESYWTVFAFSPCGRLAASASGDTVIVFDPETGRVVRTLRGHTGRVTALAFSANGKRLASGSSDSTVLIWDVTAP